MSKDRFVKKVPDTNIEFICRSILQEMKDEGTVKKFISHHWIETQLYERNRKKSYEADFFVDDVLIIEVQGYHHEKHARHMKDIGKRSVLESMGNYVLWLWGKEELLWAAQVKRGEVWKPTIKNWIMKALSQAHKLHSAWMVFRNIQLETVWVIHPDFDGLIDLRTRND